MMIEPAESVPNLQSKQWTWRILLAIAGVALVGLVVALIAFKLQTPGGDACDRVDELAAADPRGAQIWDRAVAREASRYVEVGLTSGKSIELDGDRRARCERLFEVMKEARMHGQFDKVVRCVSDAKTMIEQARCL